jgi:hypothetical protein
MRDAARGCMMTSRRPFAKTARMLLAPLIIHMPCTQQQAQQASALMVASKALYDDESPPFRQNSTDAAGTIDHTHALHIRTSHRSAPQKCVPEYACCCVQLCSPLD